MTVDVNTDAEVDTPLIEFDISAEISAILSPDDYINLVEVMWASAEARWEIEGRFAKSKREVRAHQSFTIKTDAVREAIRYCKAMASSERRLELQIRNKNGQIGKGGSAKRSYGRDPRGEG